MSDTHASPAGVGSRPSVQDNVHGDLNRVIGSRVGDLLRASGHSQLELAGALGLDQAAVSRRLAGRVPWRVTDVAVAAQFLGVTAAELMAPEAAAS